MKRKKSYFSFKIFLLITILIGFMQVPAFAQSPPTLDGKLDDLYKSHGRSYSYKGFYLNANATLYIIDNTSIDPTYVYIAWVIDPAFNDATYGDNKHDSWGGTGHTFHDLYESDKQRLDMENDCGEVVLDVTMDLLDGPGYATPSGFDAVFNTTEDSLQTYINNPNSLPDPWVQMDYSTSMDYNVNTLYNETLCVVNNGALIGTGPLYEDGTSPPLTTPYYDPVTGEIVYNHADPDCGEWQWELVWEMRVERAVFAKTCVGCACDGVFQGVATNPVELHASPSKSISPVTAFPDPGLIGDYVWHDIDRDGVQDVTEPGFANVTLALYTDPNGDGNPADGSIIETTVTDLNGYYAFLNVGEGNYIVEVTDTNDVLGLTDPTPVFSSTTGGETHGTIDLEQGESYLDADFGYALADSTKAVIGDFVWIDADNDGMQDAGEPGIGGVTLRIIADLNDDLVWDPLTETIATTTTADDGSYLFTNLDPEDYKVEVTDTGGVLSGYTLTTGPQSSVNPTQVIRVAAGDAYLNADFGYYKAAGLYSIGNQVWLEYDKAGRPPVSATSDPPDSGHGEYESAKATDTGIGSVTLNLFKDTGVIGELEASDLVIATTTTSSDTITPGDLGTYSFNGLPPGNYLVVVSDINNVLEDFRKSLYYYSEPDPIFGTSGDPTTDTTVDNYSKREAYALTITNADNNTADFGYWVDRNNNTPGMVGDFVWYDQDRDGVQDPGEPGIEGVRVELWRMKKQGASWIEDKKLGEAYTDANGYHLFRNLPVGSGSNKTERYRVKVLDSTSPDYNNWAAGNALEGFTTTPTNPPPGPNPNYKDSVDLYNGGTTVDLTLDFGYYLDTSGGTYSIGDYVWLDENEDGIQDVTESGISDITLALYLDSDGDGVIDPGEPVIATTTTDASGNYTFPNLSGDDYIVKITDYNNRLSGYKQTFSYNYPTDPLTTEVAWDTAANGSTTAIDFGFNSEPSETPVLLSSFHAYSQFGQVIVHWETASETGTAGFYLYRHSPSDPRYQQVNKNFLPGLLHSHQGGVYRFVDDGAFPGETYTYKLVEVEFSGKKRFYGPFTVTVGAPPEGIDTEPMQGIYSKKPHNLFSTRKADRLLARQMDKQNAGIQKKSRVGNEVKIVVKKKGIYYLDAASIANMLGMSPKQVEQKITNNQFLMTNWGLEIAYLPADGSTGIYFYGQDIDSLYTDENLYWLEKRKGSVMETVYGGQPSSANGNDTFMETLQIEEDHYAATALFNDPGEDYWMWDYILGGSAGKSFTFNAPGAAAAGTASFTVCLQGATDTAANPDHHVKVSLNGTWIGESQWNGKDPHRFTVPIDQSLIIDGTNTIELTGLLPGGAPYSLFYVDSFQLDYNRHYRAVDDRIICRGDENPVVTIEGFTGSNIKVFDVTDPLQPKLVTGTAIDFIGTHRVSFNPSSPGNIYAAVSTYGAQAPFSAFANKASGLKKNENKADYVVIVPEGLEDVALGLTDLRREKGMDAMVVELEDIYDEFNYGSPSPEAIKDFLTYAYHNWNKTGPQYVVLAGEGTYDYKNIMGYGDNLVPSMLMKTNRSLFASDNWFADVVGNDGVPEIAIGRLPVMTAAELQDYIDKISRYESSGGQWTSRVLMLADNPDQAGDFPTDSSYLANLFPGYSVQLIHLPDFPTAEQARQKVLEGFNNGAALVNYIGHAGLDRLAQEKLLWTGDVPALQNWDRLPMMTAMTCTVGRFGIPGYDSLSEILVLKSDGGVAAMWAPTGLSLNHLARQLAENFFKAAFLGQEKTVGKAVMKALADYKALDGPPFMLHIYVLLGDPALEIK